VVAAGGGCPAVFFFSGGSNVVVAHRWRALCCIFCFFSFVCRACQSEAHDKNLTFCRASPEQAHGKAGGRRPKRPAVRQLFLPCASYDARQRMFAVRAMLYARQRLFTVQSSTVCPLPCVFRDARQRFSLSCVFFLRTAKIERHFVSGPTTQIVEQPTSAHHTLDIVSRRSDDLTIQMG
jgi:hypothetical protein